MLPPGPGLPRNSEVSDPGAERSPPSRDAVLPGLPRNYEHPTCGYLTVTMKTSPWDSSKGLTTLRADGSPHVVPVGFTYDQDQNLVRVITFAKSMKARHAAQGGRAVVSQVDRGRWITIEGTVRLRTEADIVAQAVEAYAGRYRQPKVREDRVVIEILIDKVMGRA